MTVLPSPVPHPLEEFPFDVPRWTLQAVEWVLGAGWPPGDEAATWDVADRWYALAADLAGPHDAAQAAAARIVTGYHDAGIAADGFLDAWHRLSGEENAPLNALLQIARELGEWVEECGRDIEAAKLEVWIEIGLFLIELQGIALTTALTLGASSPAAGGLIAATRIAVQRILDRLTDQLGTRPIGRATAGKTGPEPAPTTGPDPAPQTTASHPETTSPGRRPARPETLAEPPPRTPPRPGPATRPEPSRSSPGAPGWSERTVRIEPGDKTRRIHPAQATDPSGQTRQKPPPQRDVSVRAGRPPASWNAFTEPNPEARVRQPSLRGPSTVDRVYQDYAENQREDYLRYLASLADESRAKIRDLEWGAERAGLVGAAPRGVALRRQATQIVPIVAEIEARIKLIRSTDLVSRSAGSLQDPRDPDPGRQAPRPGRQEPGVNPHNPGPSRQEPHPGGQEPGADPHNSGPSRQEPRPGGQEPGADPHNSGPSRHEPSPSPQDPGFGHGNTGSGRHGPSSDDGNPGTGLYGPGMSHPGPTPDGSGRRFPGPGDAGRDHRRSGLDPHDPGNVRLERRDPDTEDLSRRDPSPDDRTSGPANHDGPTRGPANHDGPDERAPGPEGHDGPTRRLANHDRPGGPAGHAGPDGWARTSADVGGLATGGVHSDDWSALTGDGGGRPIDQTRHYHVSGGLRRPSAVHQAALEEAMPAAGDGRAARLADPRVGDWFASVNDGGPGADPTRGLNCLDTVLALFDTYLHGRPRVAAARTFDGYAQGDPDRTWGGEWDALERIRLATGAAFQNLCPFVGAADPALAKPAVDTALSNLANHLHNSGHGAYAFVLTDLEDGGCHAWAAVNQDGTILYLDPQVARISAEAPLYRHRGRPAHANVVSMDALVVTGQGEPAPLPFHGPGQWAVPDRRP